MLKKTRKLHLDLAVLGTIWKTPCGIELDANSTDPPVDRFLVDNCFSLYPQDLVGKAKEACSVCLNSKELQERLLEIEIGYDGNIHDWLDKEQTK